MQTWTEVPFAAEMDHFGFAGVGDNTPLATPRINAVENNLQGILGVAKNHNVISVQ